MAAEPVRNVALLAAFLLQLAAVTSSVQAVDYQLVDALTRHFAMDRLVLFKKGVPTSVKERRSLLKSSERPTKMAHRKSPKLVNK